MKRTASLLTPNLDALDQDKGVDLVLGLFSDERPLREVTGMVDWRLCGQLSSYIASGRLLGAPEEQVLMPGAGRIGPERIFLFGLGKRAQYPEGIGDLLTRIGRVLRQAGSRQATLGLPGPSRVLAPFLDRFLDDFPPDRMKIFDVDGHLSEWLEHR